MTHLCAISAGGDVIVVLPSPAASVTTLAMVQIRLGLTHTRIAGFIVVQMILGAVAAICGIRSRPIRLRQDPISTVFGVQDVDLISAHSGRDATPPGPTPSD